MFADWLRWTKVSRWRTAAQLGCILILLGLGAFFWSDFCLWRADVNLKGRNHLAAASWVARSKWFHHSESAQSSLIQLRLARRLQNFREVERRLQEAAKSGVPQSEIRRERLLATVQTNQFGMMQGQWPELLGDPRDDGPEIARSYYNWLMLNHNPRQAEKTLKLWQQDYPFDPEPLTVAGRHYQAQADWKGAEESYRAALALAPNNDEYRLNLANALQVRLKTKEAVPLFQDYLRRHPDDLSAIQGLAQCASNNGDFQTAVGLLQKAIAKNPDEFLTQKLLGETLLASGDAVAAVTVLEKAYRAVPEHANLAYTLARALKATGRAAEAEPLFQFVAESRPFLGQLLDLEKQLQSRPDDLELRMKIASITAKYVSRQDAIRWYKILLQSVPNYLPAHRALQEIYESTGQHELAEVHEKFMAQHRSLSNDSKEADPVQGSTTIEESTGIPR